MPLAIYDNTIIPSGTSTRRSFLHKVATLAAAGATGGAAAAVVRPAPAEAGPVGGAENYVSPAFHEIGDEIDDAYDAWLECAEDCEVRDRALAAWEKRYPIPSYRQPDEEGYHPTSRSDWQCRRQAVMRQLRLAENKRRRSELSAAFHDAVHRFADLEAKTPAELFRKTGYGLAFGKGDGIIAKSVLRDLYNFRTLLLTVPA